MLNHLFQINFDLNRLWPYHEPNCFDDPEFTWIANIFLFLKWAHFFWTFPINAKKITTIANDVETFDFNSLYLWSMSMNNKLDQYFFVRSFVRAFNSFSLLLFNAKFLNEIRHWNVELKRSVHVLPGNWTIRLILFSLSNRSNILKKEKK